MKAITTAICLTWSSVASAQVWEPPPLHASKPPGIRPGHEGFTFGLQLGFGAALVGGTRGASGTSAPGLGGLDALVGGFLTHDLAVALKIDLFNGSSGVGSFAAFGAVAQYWFGDEITVIGGVGLGTGSKIDGTSFGLIIGGTWNFWRPAPQHGIGVYLDATPVFSDPAVIVIQGGAEWQFF